MNYSKGITTRELKRYSSLFPKPDIIFLVDVPAEIAYQRKCDVPSLSYLEERNKIYHSIQGEYGMIPLDGCKTVEELHGIIEDLVNKKMVS